MKTISLEEALKIATKGPLEVLPEYGNKIADQNEELLAIVENPSTSMFNRPKWEMNAALLAHAYNLLPELVEALKRLQNHTVWRMTGEGTGDPDIIDLVPGLLTKANTVQLP